MTALGRIRAAFLTIALAVVAFFPAAAVAAGSTAYVRLAPGDLANGHPINLGINKSVVIDLPKPAGDVLVSNPQIADAVLRTSTRLYLIGMELGQASVFLFDTSGGQIGSFDINVDADLGVLNGLLAEAITDGYVHADALNGSIVLRGQVASSSQAARAVEITQKMIAAQPTSVTTGSSTGNAAGNASSTSQSSTFDPSTGPGVINLIEITGEEQVALKVQVVEVQRSVVKQLGINATTLLNGTNFVFQTLAGAGASPINFPFTPATPTNPGGFSTTYTGDTFNVGATLRALEETRMLRTIAEPTLTAVSGETANFLAGGEFPVPITGSNGQLSIDFKPFGVNLAFTPVVLSAGRISLKVRSEVSQLSTNGAISVPISSGQSVTIPATSVRRAETTVELPSGGAFVIAGLIQENTKRSVSGLPWLQKLPILGTLFSSKDFLTDQTELVMIVTPYLVKPTSPSALTTPGENLMNTSDAEAYFLNRLTKVYGTKSQVPGGAGAAKVGFTFD